MKFLRIKQDKKYNNYMDCEETESSKRRIINYSTVIFLLLIVASLALTFLGLHAFFTAKEADTSDIKQIKGTAVQINHTGGNSSDIVLKLQEYPHKFSVSHIQLAELNKNNFNFEVFYGAELSLSISKKDFDSYISNSHIPKKDIQVYSVSSKNKDYLNVEGYNKCEKSNARNGLAVAALSLITGIGMAIFYLKCD